MLQRARLLGHTLRYLKPWQVGGRIVARLRQRVGLTQVPQAPARLQGRLQAHVAFPQHEPWNDAESLRKGRFCFLQRTADLGRPVDWAAAGMPLLWRFNLHYFHYLHLLEGAEQEALCREWVQANPVGAGVGWHPYPTSLRIVNWCRADLRAADLQQSLYRQAAHLYRNLETYVYGNHLMENARALVYAGRFFDGQGEAPRWLEKGLALYRQETGEQILHDGGHYERSPMYHALMLEGYLDVLNLLPRDHPDRSWLEETVQRMGDALVSMVHPDGQLALFNDATQEIAAAPARLVTYARDLTGRTFHARDSLPDTGYFVHRGDGVYLIVDGGAAGPEHLMAHAHADVFSFELSLGGQQIVVDTGVFEYADGPMRRLVRSTSAHNTVCVDDTDQIECWGSFRVARRTAPKDVVFSRHENGSTFEGTFDGYARWLGDGIVHRRRVTCDEARREIRVVDEIQGRGRHRVESRLHLHPDVEVTEAGEITLRRGEVTCRVQVERGSLRWEEGVYCPAFGVRRANRVLVLGGETALPAALAFTIRY